MESFRVSGRSMEPYLKKKIDIVVIQKIDICKIKRGDVIAFYNLGNKMIDNKTNVICHRVIKVHKKKEVMLLEKGDFYLESSWVNKEQLIGKVVRIYRGKNCIECNKSKIRSLNKIIAIISRYYDIKYKWYQAKTDKKISREKFLGKLYLLNEKMVNLFMY